MSLKKKKEEEFSIADSIINGTWDDGSLNVSTPQTQSVANTVNTLDAVSNNIKNKTATMSFDDDKKEDKNTFSFSIDNKKEETPEEERKRKIQEYNKKIAKMNGENASKDEAWNNYVDSKDNVKLYEKEKGINAFNKNNKKNRNDKEYQRLLEERSNTYNKYYQIKKKEDKKNEKDYFEDGYNFGDLTKTVGQFIDEKVNNAYDYAEAFKADKNSGIKKLTSLGKELGGGAINFGLNMVDAPIQDIQEGTEKGKNQSGIKNYIQGVAQTLDPYGLSNLPETIKEAQQIASDPTKSTKDKAINIGMQFLRNNQIVRTLEGAGKQINMVNKNAPETIQNVRNIINSPIDKINNSLYKDRQQYSNAFQDVLEGTGSAGAQIPAALISTVTGNPDLGLFAMGVGAKGQATNEALQQGADINLANNIGTTKQLLEMGTEKMSNLGSKYLGKGKTDDVVEAAIDRIIPENKLANFLTKKGMGVVGEIGEEELSNYLGVQIDKATVNPDASYSLKDIKDTAKSTAISTLIMNLLTGQYGTRAYRQNALSMAESQRTESEQAVFQDILNNRVAKATENGTKKIKGKELLKIAENLTNEVATGQISLDNFIQELQNTSQTQEIEQPQIPTQTPINTLSSNIQEQNNQILSQQQTPQITPLNQVNQELQETRQQDVADSVRAMNLQQEPEFTQKQGNYVYEKSDNSKIDNFRKDAATYLKAGEQTDNFVKTLEKIIEDKGIEIRFDPNLRDNQGRMANGSYSNNVITLNPNSNRAGEFLAIHELTHAIGTKSMIKMIKNYRKSNAEFDSAVKKLLTTYKSTEINEETLGDIAGQLFGNQEYINNLSMENPSLFKKIYNEIKYLWHQFTGYKNQDQFIEDLRNKWESAYRNQKVQQKAKNSNIEMSTQTDSNGNMLSNEQVDYFKDSKVRNENGNLIPVYHGSPNEFTVFDKGRMKTGATLYASSGDGFYFTDNETKANKYSKGGYKYSTYLNLTNPFVVENNLSNEASNILTEFSHQIIDTHPEATQKDFGAYEVFDKNDIGQQSGTAILSGVVSEYGDEFTKFLKNKGYDGIKSSVTDYDNYGEKYNYVAFESNQIKNIDNLTPTQDDDIRYSKNEELDNSSFSLQKKYDDIKNQREELRQKNLELKQQRNAIISTIPNYSMFKKYNETSNIDEQIDKNHQKSLELYEEQKQLEKQLEEAKQQEKQKKIDEVNKRTTPFKDKQFKIIQKSNPMTDDYHTGIRQPGEIRTWTEAMYDAEKDGEGYSWGDFTKADAEKALKNKTITIYSSYPIKNGVFVTPSKIQAEQYAGGEGSRVYSKTVRPDRVAWINVDEGQYADAGINTYEAKYSKDNQTWREYLEKEFPGQGTRTNLQDINERNKPKQDNKTTQEEKPQEMPKKEVKQEVKKSYLTSAEQNELDGLRDLYETGLLEETDADYKRLQELEKKSQGITKKFPELKKTVTQEDTKPLYFKYKDNEISKENNKILNEAKNIVEANKQGRRTKEQWLQVAEYIGSNADIKNSTDLQKLAMETWLASRPNTKDNLNRQGKKYVDFKTNEWFNAMYKGAGVGTDVKMSLEENTINENKQEDKIVLRTHTEIQPKEMPKNPVADSVKVMNLEKENIKYSAEEKIEKSVRNQYKGLSEDKIQRIIELKEEQKEKDKMYSNFSNKQRAKQRIMINAYETNAKIRKIVQGDSLEKVKGGLTDIELAKAIEKENSNYIGKKVIVDGQNGTVIGNPYGRVKVEFEDGTIKTVDKSDVKSINESKKDEVVVLRTPTEIQPKEVKTPEQKQEYFEESGTPKKVAKILSETPRETETSTLREKYQTLKRAVVDKGEAIYRIAKQTKNRRLYAMYDRIGLATGEGNSDIGISQTNLDGESYKNFTDSKGNKISMSLNDIWKDVEDSNIPENVMNEYLANYLNVDRYKANQLSIEEIEELKDLNKYKNLSKTQKERVEELNTLAETRNVFGKDITREDSLNKIKEIEEKYPQIKRPAENIWQYGKNQLQKMVDAGLVSKESQEYYNENTPHYVRLQRSTESKKGSVFDSRGHLQVNNQIKKAKGGTKDIIPFKDSMAQYTLDTTSSIRKNLFGQELSKTLKNGLETDGNVDIDNIDNNILNANEDGSYTFKIFKDGKPEVLTIDKGIYEALQPNKHYELEKLFTPFRAVSNFKRTVLTDKNPLFLATNFFKDFFDAPLNTKHSTVDFVKNYGVAINQILKNGEYYQKYQALGGNQNTYFDKEGFSKPSKISKIVAPIEKANEFIEMLPRMSEFITSLKKGESLDEAMYNAAEITTNFKRGGTATKIVNRNGATFLNASVQGFDKQIRNFTEIENPKQAVRLLTKALVLGVAPALLNAVMYDDDDEYEDLPDYVKDSYYLFKTGKDNKWVRIPKGRAISVIQAAARRTYNYSKGDKDAYKGLVGHFENQLAPNNPLESNVLSPLVDVKNNKAWSGNKIVSDSIANTSHPEEEYDAKTDELSKWLGQKLGKSPKKINYIIDQNTGAIGDLLLPFLTKQAEGEDDSIAGRLLKNPVKDKFTTDAVLNSKQVNQFYDAFNKAEDDKKWSKATDEDKLKYKYLYSTMLELAEKNKQIKEIESSDKSDKEKYRETKAIKQEMNDMSKKAVKESENIKINDYYAQIDDKVYKKEYDKSTGEYKYTKVQQKQLDKIKDKGVPLSDYFQEAYEKQKKRATK